MLEIMKDSRIGTYGVLALMVSFALRALALTIIISVTGGWDAFLMLLGVAAASRAAMVWHWNALPPARDNGVAAPRQVPRQCRFRCAEDLGQGLSLGHATDPALGGGVEPDVAEAQPQVGVRQQELHATDVVMVDVRDDEEVDVPSTVGA